MLAPIHNFFNCSHLYIPPAVFVDGDTYACSSHKVNHLLNKQAIKKGKGQAIEYFICLSEYGLE